MLMPELKSARWLSLAFAGVHFVRGTKYAGKQNLLFPRNIVHHKHDKYPNLQYLVYLLIISNNDTTSLTGHDVLKFFLRPVKFCL